jgi:hypothetical protein
MSAARSLLHLFPRPWRERYGEEFLATAGEGPLHAQQVIDIVFGAIDAWLSADVRRAARTYSTAPSQGGTMTLKSILACERAAYRATKRDGMIGAALMIAGTVLFTALGMVARRSGWPMIGAMLLNLSFPVPLVLSMPFWAMKGQPWRAQAALVIGTVSILVGLAWFAVAN